MNPQLNTIKADNPRLHIINQWLRKRLEKPGEAEGTASFLARFVKEGLIELNDQLWTGISDDLVVTVRSSFRKGTRYLRPVYSRPDQLRTFLQDPVNQKPFRFSDKTTAFGAIKPFEKQENGKPYAFAGLYRVNTETSPPADSFPARINAFHNALSSLTNLAIKDVCFFAGRNKDKVSNGAIELQHILAVYFPESAQTEHAAAVPLAELLEKVEVLFDGLDLISLIDASIFEAEGLKLVAELLPEFSKDEVAPADKIAFAVECLRVLLKGHMIGRHGGDNEGKPPKFFYIATSFERMQDPEKSLHPRLEIYPHIYRKQHLEASYFVTHRNIPSATKFLLWRYLKSPKHLIVETTSASKDEARDAVQPSVNSALSFDELFDAERLQTAPLSEWQDVITPPNFPDFLHLTSGDGGQEIGPGRQTPWVALNKPPDADFRSIAAFIVEGRIIGRLEVGEGNLPSKTTKHCLPRGIFVIESHYEDGFSDADIKSLRIVFRGIAALIRLISHQNAPIDYRSLIASTFARDAELDYRSDPKVLRLLFLVQKLDAELLHELLKKCCTSDEVLKAYGLDASSLTAVQKLAEICPGEPKPNPEKREQLLRDRMQKLQRLFFFGNQETKHQLLSHKVLAFLEACPENFTWASYLACMAQTLGDRIAGTALPQFSRMMPGFSASGMFMAMVDGELRQVVKLSTARKLKNENTLYRKWVRYRIVSAARIPANGLAFETTGELGKDCALREEPTITPESDEKDIASDGVLVSDLVSGGKGREQVKTLLDLVAKNVGALRDDNTPTPSTINRALRAVFGANAKLWSAVPEIPTKDQTIAVFSAFRIPLPNSDRREKFEKDIARLKTLRKTGTTDLNFGSLLKLFGLAAPETVGDLREEHFRICHGDLTSRNLTWAEELRSFFLIDFERVGPNIVGTDQLRLVVNLVTELRLGWDSVRNSDLQKGAQELAHLYLQLEDGLDYVRKVFTVLIGPGNADPHLTKIASDLAPKTNPRRTLVETLHTILTTVAPVDLRDANWRFHWALMLLCSAAKQFSYTCRLAEEAKIAEALDGKQIDDFASMLALEHHVEKYTKGKPGSMNLTGNFMWHFVAARLLLSFVDAMREQVSHG